MASNKNLIWIVAIGILMFCMSTTAVFAAVVPGSSDLYIGVSEADSFTDPSTIECENLALGCGDNDFNTKTNRYTVLSDGDTGTGLSITNKSNSNSVMLKVIYDVSSLVEDGNFSLRMAHENPDDHLICAYINDTHINTTSCVIASPPSESGLVWRSHNIDRVVRESFNKLGRISLRIIPTTGTTMGVDEIYLERPFVASDFSVVPTGVEEAGIDSSVENTWLIESRTDIETSPEIEVNGCSVNEMGRDNSSYSITLMNSSDLDVVINDTLPRHFHVRWYSNQSAGVDEGSNYEVICNATIGGVEYPHISQYVYINREKSIWDRVTNIWNTVLDILGLVRENQALLNETLNSTIKAEIDVQQVEAFVGEDITVTSVLADANQYVNDATCDLTTYYPNVSVWLDSADMTSVGSNGIYKRDITLPQVTGEYRANVECVNGSLGNYTSRGSTTWRVSNGVRMSSIS